MTDLPTVVEMTSAAPIAAVVTAAQVTYVHRESIMSDGSRAVLAVTHSGQDKDAQSESMAILMLAAGPRSPWAAPYRCSHGL